MKALEMPEDSWLGIYLKKINFGLKIAANSTKGKRTDLGKKKHKGAIKKKGKVTPLSRATNPRKDPAAVNICCSC